MKKSVVAMLLISILFVSSCGKTEPQTEQKDTAVAKQEVKTPEKGAPEKTKEVTQESTKVETNTEVVQQKLADLNTDAIKKIEKEIAELKKQKEPLQKQREKLQQELEEEKQKSIEADGVWKERGIDDTKIVEQEQSIDTEIEELTGRKTEIEKLHQRINMIAKSKKLKKFHDEKLGLLFTYPEAWGEVELEVYESLTDEIGNKDNNTKSRSIRFTNFPEVYFTITDIGFNEELSDPITKQDYDNYKNRRKSSQELVDKNTDRLFSVYEYGFMDFFGGGGYFFNKKYSIYIDNLENKIFSAKFHLDIYERGFLAQFLSRDILLADKDFLTVQEKNGSDRDGNYPKGTYEHLQTYITKLHKYVTSDKIDTRYKIIEKQIEDMIESIEVVK